MNSLKEMDNITKTYSQDQCLTSGINEDTCGTSGIEALPAHCLICNGPLTENVEQRYNIFSQLRMDECTSRISVFEKIGHILRRTLGSINLHSEMVCHQCFRLLQEYDETENKLQIICAELTYKFNDTAEVHQDFAQRSTKENNADHHIIKEASEDPKPYRNVFIINEEGKLVDENGKERKEPVNFTLHKKGKIIKTKGRKSINGKRYVCSVCGKGFRAFSHRVEHMLIHLGEKPWTCEECKKTFRTKSALRVHSMKHTGERPFTCEHCGKSFVDKCYFEEHCRVHSGDRPFVCLFCKRHFTRKKDLVIHMKTHTGDKPHVCTMCSKSFAVKSRLERHKRIHSGEKPHTCEYCGKCFSRKDDYKVHVRQHTGERPFHCSYCNKTFTNQSNCLAHIRTHTGIKNYQCNICEEGFNRRMKLDKHIAESHPNEEIVEEGTKLGNEIQHEVHPVTEPISLSGCSSVMSQSLLQPSSLQAVSVSELHTIQALPVGQVAQVTWSDNLVSGSGAAAYVNIVPGTYVNIIN